MIARRRVLAAGAAGSAALTLAACGSGGSGGSGGGDTDPTDTEANADKTVTLWIMQGANAKTDEYVEALKTAFRNRDEAPAATDAVLPFTLIERGSTKPKVQP